MQIPEMEQKMEKSHFVFQIIALNWECEIPTMLNRIFPIGSQCVTNSPKISPNTRGDISGSTFLIMMKKHDKSAVMEILQLFGTLSRVDFTNVFWNGAFQRVLYAIFLSLLFWKYISYISYDDHLFFQNL